MDLLFFLIPFSVSMADFSKPSSCINIQNSFSKMLVFDQYRAWYNNTVSLVRHIISGPVRVIPGITFASGSLLRSYNPGSHSLGQICTPHLLIILTKLGCHPNRFWGSRCDSNHAPTISLKPRPPSRRFRHFLSAMTKAPFITN